MQGVKLQDVKMTDQFAQHEIAAQQDMKLQDRKLQDMKMPDMKMTDKNDDRTRSCRRTNRVLTVCKFLNPKHRNTLCIRFHTGVCSSRQIKPTLL